MHKKTYEKRKKYKVVSCIVCFVNSTVNVTMGDTFFIEHLSLQYCKWLRRKNTASTTHTRHSKNKRKKKIYK